MVRLVPLLKLRHLGDRRFDYQVPPELAGRLRVGSIVTAPFGRRTVRAVVVEEGGSAEVEPSGLRPIEAVADDRVPEELVHLAHRLADRYLSSYESCLRLMIPPGLGAPDKAPPAPRKTWAVRAGGPLEAPAGAALGSETVAVADLGLRDGAPDAPESGAARPDASHAGMDTPITGASAPNAGASVRLTPRQQTVLDAIPAQGVLAQELCRQTGAGRGVLRALIAKGLVGLRVPPEDGLSIVEPGGPRSAAPGAPGVGAAGTDTAWGPSAGVPLIPELRPEQGAAVQELLAAYEAPGFSRRLLWGVTGSGKTEVYLRLLERVIQEGAGAILLVPEIGLTPLMIRRVKERFGARVGVLHSGLSRGERLREYRRVADGRVQIVVGARSAVFAPVRDLRMVIVDEAHDSSYKQEDEPRYHACTVARMRLEGSDWSGQGLLLEGSATPSVESMREAARLRLARRAAGTEPALEVVDMRHQGAGGLLAPLSREVLAETLRRGEQAIVLLNRRGYAGHVHCDLCGYVMMCDECELSLTYHKRVRRLLCHQCGRAYLEPALCPQCGRAPLTRSSPGTERLDQELRALVPHEQVFRMDSDTLSSAAKAGAVLEAFAAARPGILVGTQMVAKGHDFPDVTLVLVADADTGLYVPDFRAAERTFQLLTQVAGRAGRAHRPGRVLVQTWNPDVPCIRMALERDEEAFYREELRMRERLGYPPYAELIRLLTVSAEAERAQVSARYLAERLVPHFPAREVRGPARLPVVRGRHRWHLVVAAKEGARARAIIGRALAQLEEPYRRREVTLLVDVDPQSFG